MLSERINISKCNVILPIGSLLIYTSPLILKGLSSLPAEFSKKIIESNITKLLNLKS